MLATDAILSRGGWRAFAGAPSADRLWIAAHALAADLILITNNEREFGRVPGLRMENWAASA